jgi:UDP-N-acetylmuramoylalanine--D-glutamate ligase
MENYVRSKFRIGQNQKRGDRFITNAEDPHIVQYIKDNPEAVHCKTEWIQRDELANAYVRVGRIAFDMSCSNLRGPHNMFNAACAIRIALNLGIEPGLIEQGLFSFTAPPHRMEKVAVHEGITWINDSKATNVDAVQYALQAMDAPTVWILGGQDKGNDYSILLPLAKRCVKAIICMGVDNSKILAAFAPLGLPMDETRSAAEAVKAAAAHAEYGDTVLLSPACASFDLFKNYEDRGDQFRNEVHQFIQQNA